jgi:hypothetical protein
MLSDGKGKYYLRGPGTVPKWVDFEKGSIWPSMRGPIGAKCKASRGKRWNDKAVLELRVISFKLVEDDGC